MCLFDQNLGTQERGVQVAQAIPKQPPLPSTHLWLKGLPPKHACVDDVRVAFCQWLGDNGKLVGSVEDEHHLLFDCPVYSHIRQEYSHLFHQASSLVSAFLRADQANVVGGYLKTLLLKGNML